MGRRGRRSGRKPGASAAAFTLLELLLACGVTLLLVVLVLRAFCDATALWRRAESRTGTFREANAALDLMARDLRTTVAVNEAGEGTPALVLDYDPATPAGERGNEQVYALSLFSNAGRSDLCTVGYYCVWDAQAHCFVLKRLFKNSDATFDDFKNAAGTLPGFKALYARANAVEDEAASCLWDLAFRPCENGAAAGSYPRRAYSGTLPAWVEIRFKAMGPEAAAKLKALPVTPETWKHPEEPLYKTAIEPYEQSFVLRVKLNAASNP